VLKVPDSGEDSVAPPMPKPGPDSVHANLPDWLFVVAEQGAPVNSNVTEAGWHLVVHQSTK